MGCSQPNLMVFNGYEYMFRGKRNQEITLHDRGSKDVFDIPCGKCETCLIDRRYSRALRIMLEAESWPGKSYFVTLTFDNENLGHPDLDHNEWSQFIKNFRQEFCQAKYCDVSIPRHWKRFGKVRSETFKKIKQVMCGEYGDEFGRKHFHGIIFNHYFDDLRETGFYSKKGNPIRTSDALREVWKKGNVHVEEVNMDLALYVSAYITDQQDDFDVNDGHGKKQYGLFGHGIGAAWLRQYWRSVLSAGCVKTMDGDYVTPRYFLKKISEWYPEEFQEWKEKRRVAFLKERALNIEKGDGPLRRARANGAIANNIFTKRRQLRGK